MPLEKRGNPSSQDVGQFLMWALSLPDSVWLSDILSVTFSFFIYFVFSFISLRNSFIPSLKASIIFVGLDLRSLSFTLLVLGLPGITVVV